ncbi:hypothetical protein KI387_035416, partial [Taxus chinensis]
GIQHSTDHVVKGYQLGANLLHDATNKKNSQPESMGDGSPNVEWLRQLNISVETLGGREKGQDVAIYH